ncbi:MAG: tRNA pseudouridine(55) synthase TruB [Polyangiaceae bacterium]|nr:tRNA pseudouridine(55) synthase TruB [Polyangiaceae bacterium]
MSSRDPHTKVPPGVLIIDKPHGLTSHDVVARVRRILGEKRIGHAGTLDPMATGVLVVLVGEATKLAQYLTAADKRYSATVTFGTSTTTLDAEGEVVSQARIDAALLEGDLLARGIELERTRRLQVPPAFSAIHKDGVRSHELARAGKEVELDPRAVEVRSLTVTCVHNEPEGAPSVDLDVYVSKGYYVRSLARDLGVHMGVPSHLSQLRRTASGAFTVENAVSLEAGRSVLIEAIVPIEAAVARALPVARLTELGAVRARHGKRLDEADFFPQEAPPADGNAAWFDPSGALAAIGTVGEGGAFTVARGFV